MFNNLIESSSHAKEYKRRGSFLLFTGATYVLLFALTGVISIYAYDAHLETQNFEDVVLLSPQDFAPTQTPEVARPDRPRSTSDTNRLPERAVAMLSVNHPEVVPVGVSTEPNRNLSLPDHGTAVITGRDYNPESMGGPGHPSTGGGTRAVTPPQVLIPDEPPPAPTPVPAPPKILKVSVVLNSRALSLPPPTYPQLARNIRLQGTVIVQVLIDEQGNVLSAKATSGHPILIPEAQRAAMRARFSPTLLGGQPVKVQGAITYNFVIGN